MFNGITLRNLNFFGVRYENVVEAPKEDVTNNVDADFQSIMNQINEIKDDKGDANDAIEGLDGLFSSEFARKLGKVNAQKLLDAIKAKFKTDDVTPTLDQIKEKNIPGLNDLIDFLEPIVDPLSVHKAATLDEGGDVEKSQNLDENKLKKLSDDVVRYINDINIIVGDSEDSRLGEIKTSLGNIKKVLADPKNVNVEKLQEFIWNNFEGNSDIKRIGDHEYVVLKDFKDGKLGNDTLAGLEVVLKKVEKYIQDVKEAKKVEDAAKEKAAVRPVTEKKGGADVAALNGGADTTPAQSKESQILKDSGFVKDGSLTVSIGGMNIALYECSVGTSSSSDAVGEGGKSGEIESQMVENAEKLFDELGSELEKKEKKCLMQVGNSVYMVRLDSSKCLYPFAVDVKSGQKVFLKNNTSCEQYLRNKLSPSLLQKHPDIEIKWDGEDYVIGKARYNDWLTIEPITIAGGWLEGATLSQSLAFLNFTNYLRNEPGLDRERDGDYEGKFSNDNPNVKWKGGNLYVKVKKMNKEDYLKNKDDSRTWMNVDLNDFGLVGIQQNSPVWDEYKNYNNREQWNRNWSKVGGNNYHSVDFQGMIANEQRKVEAASRRTDGQRFNTPAGGGTGGGGGGNYSEVLPTDSNGGNLELVSDNDFRRAFYGIPESVKQVFVCNNTYYYQDVSEAKLVHKTSGFTDQTMTLEDGQSLSAGGSIANLEFGKPDKLEVTGGGAKVLTEKLKSVYEDIFGNGLGEDVEVTLDDKGDNYVLKVGENNSIVLGGEGFMSDDNSKILGYPIEKPEEWLKVVCYAYHNYDVISTGKQLVLNNSNEYGITDKNSGDVEKWLQSLNTSSNKLELVVLPSSLENIGSFGEDGKFIFDPDKVDNGEISIGGVDYLVNPDGSGLGVKWFDDGSELRFGNFVDGSIKGQGTSFYKPRGVDCVCKYECVFENNKPLSGGKFVHTWGVDSDNPSILSGNFQEDGNWPLTGTITCYDSGVQHTFNVGRPDNNSDWEIKDSEGYAGRFIDFNTGVLKPRQS